MKTMSPLLHNPWVKEKMKSEMKKCFEPNENESAIYQILQDITKAVLEEKKNYSSKHIS